MELFSYDYRNFLFFFQFSVGVKVLSDCGVQTAEIDTFSDPQGKQIKPSAKMYYVLKYKPNHKPTKQNSKMFKYECFKLSS